MQMDSKSWIITALVILVLILVIALIIVGSSKKEVRPTYVAQSPQQVVQPVVLQQPQQASRAVQSRQMQPIYMTLPNQDHPGDDILYRPDLAGNIQGLQQLCNETPECIGFNSGGYLKNSVSPVMTSSYDFYYRQ